MVDYMEIEHGCKYLVEFFHNKGNKSSFIGTVDKCAKGATEEAIALFDSWLNIHRFNTYIACFSEYGDDEENGHGRLSMWRAFGSDSIGVAVVLNANFLNLDSGSIEANSSPVSYLSEDDFKQSMIRTVKNIDIEIDFLKTLPREQIVGTIFHMLLFSALCSKHPGFHEEKEWRIIHLPKQNPSDILIESIEVIGGVPQTVFKIPLKNIPDRGLVGIEVPELINKIILGPSAYPWPIFDAFVSALDAAGVEKSKTKIVVSGIPLRT